MRNRIEALKDAFKTNLDCYIIANPANILYFTELVGSTDSVGAAMILVPNEGKSVFHIYSVNYEWAKAEAKNCTVELIKRGEDLTKKIAEEAKGRKMKKIGFDTMNIETYHKFNKALEDDATLEAKSEYVWNLRRVKDEDEVKRMRKAAELTVEGMQAAYDTIKAGLREYEIAAEIEYAMRTKGSYGVAFETSVASGPNSAYPHGGCGERRLGKGDIVVVDIGAVYKNYRGDMTRTFVAGRPSAEQEKIFTIVKTAQEKAFQKIRDGAKAADIDAVARGIIEKSGYGEHFVHGLGHGIGLEVHEQPTLNSTSKDVLKAGNVVTDEPGIYVVGSAGFRVEDTVLVRKDGAERLTEGLYVLKKS